MASADQLRALIESHLGGDEERFQIVALQVAADAARRGQGRLASDLRRLVEGAPSPARAPGAVGAGPVPIVQPQGELAQFLVAEYPDARLSQLVLPQSLRDRLERVLRENRGREKLSAYGLSPRRKLLLVGPPGCGKTFTAAALAAELSLPLFTVRLDGLLSRYLGESAGRLGLLFGALAETRGVYLFDEFDSVGAERGAASDVGEMRRVLTAFLQLLERDRSQSLIVAATNTGDALDGALFRRFDDILKFELPSIDLLVPAMKSYLGAVDARGLDWDALQREAQGLSFAEIAQACLDASKEAVLDDVHRLSTGRLLMALRERKAGRAER